MKTFEIETSADVGKLIDRIGDLQNHLDIQKLELTTIVNAVKLWIACHPEDRRGKTDRYQYAIKEFTRALCRQRSVKLEEVVCKLREDELTRDCIVEAYNEELLKDIFGKTAKSRADIEKYGLYFSKPRTELKVENLG